MAAADASKLTREGDAEKRATFACTDEEWEKVLQLRERCSDLSVDGYWGTEQCLHRFVVARKLDVDAAEKQYRGAIQWRKVGGHCDRLECIFRKLLLRRMQKPTRFKTGFGSLRLFESTTQVDFMAPTV